MKIHPIIAGAIVTAIFALQGWTLYELVELKVEFAEFRGAQSRIVASK
jgi:hypothetical protein